MWAMVKFDTKQFPIGHEKKECLILIKFCPVIGSFLHGSAIIHFIFE